MKFLLTSQGLENESIKAALADLLGKPYGDSQVTFVTTASHASPSDKRWLFRIFSQFDELGFRTIDTLDFAGLPEDVWLPRLQAADLLMFTGGNTIHLAYEMQKAGMKERLDELLKTRVYAGNSAGSIVATKDLSMSNPDDRGYSTSRDLNDFNETLGYLDFHIRPHWKHPDHAHSTEAAVQEKIEKYHITDPVYLIDDQTAIKVDGENVEVVSEGDWKVCNQ